MACLFAQARPRLHRQRQQFKPLLMWRCNLPAGQQDPLRYAFHSIFFKSIATLADDNGRVRKHDPHAVTWLRRRALQQHLISTLSFFSHTELHQCSKDDSGFTATAYCCVLQLGVVAAAARGALTAAQDVAAAIVSGNAPSAAANASNATRTSAEAASAAVLAQGGNADDAYAARAATAALIAAQAAATAAAAAGALGIHLL